MARGRPPAGPEVVANVAGSDVAKERVRLILETVAGKMSVADACEKLAISEARFRELRDELLQAAVARLEPKPAGRPRQHTPEELARISQLEAQVEHLKVELRASQIREEIALVMPHLIEPRNKEESRRRRLDAMLDATQKKILESSNENHSTPKSSGESGS
jgi:hypothetical protein